jgi:O-antigen ligase
MLFITQSRTAMVALVPGLLIAFLLLMAFSRVARRTKLYIAGGTVTALVLSVLLSLALGLSNLIEDRFGQEAELVSQVIEGDLDEIPKSSWGLRLLFISEAFDGISERPLTGWGYRAGEIVLDTPELRQGDGGVFSQVHNSYLEAALRYGIGGLIVVLGLFAWAVVGILRCWRHRQMPLDMMIFLGATFSYFMVANLFDGLLFQTEGVLMFNVLMGVAASYIFQDMQLSAREPERHI